MMLMNDKTQPIFHYPAYTHFIFFLALQLVVDFSTIVRVSGSRLNSLSSLADLALDSLGGVGGGARAGGSIIRVGGGGRTRGDIDLVRAVLLDELDEVLNGPVTAVGDGGVLLASGEQLDGREALDIIRDVVGGGINLGNNDLVAERLGQGSELIVLGSKTIMFELANAFSQYSRNCGTYALQ